MLPAHGARLFNDAVPPLGSGSVALVVPIGPAKRRCVDQSAGACPGAPAQRCRRDNPNGDLAMGAGEVGIRSGGPPRPAQRLPANQRAPEREERLVDVGPLVIPHAQAAKLTEPGKCALHDPAPPAQSTPVRASPPCTARMEQLCHDRCATTSNGWSSRLLSQSQSSRQEWIEDPTTDLEAARPPYPFTLPRRRGQASEVLLDALRN